MNFSIDQFLAALSASFGNITISYQELDYNGKIPVFFVRYNNLEDLATNWTRLIDAIAFDFQSQLTDEFQIWNIYVFFIRPMEVTDERGYENLKLKIENDTFSSRKILVEEDDTDAIINEHILNNNVNFSTDQVKKAAGKFDADPLLWSLLEDKVLKKQKMTGEAGGAFDELVKLLKTPNP